MYLAKSSNFSYNIMAQATVGITLSGQQAKSKQKKERCGAFVS